MKPESNNTLEDIAVKKVIDLLTEIPSFEVVSVERNVYIVKHQDVDILIKFTIQGENKVRTMIVEVKNSAQPRVVHRVIDQLARYRISCPDWHIVIISPYVSEEAGAICLAEDVNYLDFAGNCHLSIGPVFIDRTGKPNIYKTERESTTIFSPKASRVVRMILNDPKEDKIRNRATKSGASIGRVSDVTTMLKKRGVIKEDGSFSFLGLTELLQEWGEIYSYRINEVTSYKSSKNIREIEADIATVCDEKGIEYAMTGFAGASRLLPDIQYNSVMAYVYNPIEVAPLLNLSEVTGSEGNLILLKPYDEGVYYANQMIDGIRIVSPVQIYLDLLGGHHRDRSEEVAEAILAIIKSKWQTGNV
ncbi:MAG: hypothetical protein HQK96_11165 [Nitrospirae bacterium]|nr:hypothetical protein [Nitrospirota bacterium]